MYIDFCHGESRYDRGGRHFCCMGVHTNLDVRMKVPGVPHITGRYFPSEQLLVFA